MYFQMPLKLVEVLLLLPLLHPQQILAKLLNGLETITVMMRTTMRDVAGMAETVAETMSTPNFALHVNVWILMEETMEQLIHQPNHLLNLQLNLLLVNVNILDGLETIIVTMATTMKNVAGMVETAAETT